MSSSRELFEQDFRDYNSENDLDHYILGSKSKHSYVAPSLNKVRQRNRPTIFLIMLLYEIRHEPIQAFYAIRMSKLNEIVNQVESIERYLKEGCFKLNASKFEQSEIDSKVWLPARSEIRYPASTFTLNFNNVDSIFNFLEHTTEDIMLVINEFKQIDSITGEEVRPTAEEMIKPFKISGFLNSDISEDKLVIDTLRSLSSHKRLILVGSPGTGKSFIASKVFKLWKEGKRRLIQFHPNFSYQEFIGGKIPIHELSDKDRKDYEDQNLSIPRFLPKSGVFVEFSSIAFNDPENDYLLLIEEINRANLSAVFGEAISLLDENPPFKEIHLSFSDSAKQPILRVPPNMHILATMNDADETISQIDKAIGRRFAWLRFEPDYDILNRRIDTLNIAELLKIINERLDKTFLRISVQVGHSFFIKNGEIICTWEELYDIWFDRIIPYMLQLVNYNKRILREIFDDELIMKTGDFSENIEDFKRAVINFIG